MVLEPSLVSDILSVLGTAAVTAVVTLTGIRRRASRDKTEIVKDRAEESVIKHLEEQRDRACIERDSLYDKLKVADKERVDALNKVLKLTSEVEYLSGQIKILKELVEGLGRNLDSNKKELKEYSLQNALLLEKIEQLGGPK